MNESQLRRDIENQPLWSQTLALAATYQACHHVNDIANGLALDDQLYKVLMHSILNTDPLTSTQAYFSLAPLGQACDNLAITLKGKHKTPGNKPVPSGNWNETDKSNTVNNQKHYPLRYTMSALQLQKLIKKQPQKLNELSQRINSTQRYIELQYPQVMAQPSAGIDPNIQQVINQRFAEIYLDIFGQLNLRIIIQGKPEALKNTHCVHSIRTLLLAAIRSAFLWQQVGGSGWKLLFTRKKIIDICELLSQRIATEVVVAQNFS